jgi:hypothetical protein
MARSIGSCFAASAVVLLALNGDVRAQESQAANVHWAYSSYFGTGWYRVDGDRDVFVLRLSTTWELAESSYENGERKIGLYLRTPVSAGLDRFDIDDIPDAVDLDNVSFLSFNPGLDVEIPVNDIWSLRPYASVGYGRELNSSGEYAWTYWGGVKSRVELHAGERSNWYLINKLGYVGYTPKTGESDSFWPAMAGIEVNHPLGQRTESGSQWLLHWNAGYTYFGNDIFFSRSAEVNQDISDQWEVGAAIGRKDDPVKIWFLEFDRLGLGLRTSSSGDLQGVTFIFRSAFEK